MLRRTKSHRGQGLTEYGLLIALILGILVLVVPTIGLGYGYLNSSVSSAINSAIGGGNGGTPTPTPGGGTPSPTPAPPVTYRAAVLATNPVAYWRLGESPTPRGGGWIELFDSGWHHVGSADLSPASDGSFTVPSSSLTAQVYNVIFYPWEPGDGWAHYVGWTTVDITTQAAVVNYFIDPSGFTGSAVVTAGALGVVGISGNVYTMPAAHDEMGANDGTYVGGPTLDVTGLLNGDPNTAVTFDNSGNQLVRIASASAGPTAGFTFLCWASRTGTWTYYPDLFDWNAESAAGSVEIGVSPAGQLFYGFSDGTFRLISTNVFVAYDVSVYIAVAHDFAAKTVKIYVNGSLMNTSDLSAYGTPVPVPAGKMLDIGNYLNGNPQASWSGTIDEPAIWNRALSADEIAALYAAGTGF